MSLSSGTRLGSYEILSPLGAGGMGEVYRARDGKLSRDVALKILPATFAMDADRVARFRREAQVLASLNHPNIGHIYGFEDTTTPPALVLELVDGPTLADRLAHGPLPLAEAVSIARQIADALEAAHERGVIHRDLKPANVKVRDDGTVKVLDFGLAKALDPIATASPEALNSPTLTARATQLGVVLGTAAYMAPEQAKGKAVDRRADIWAFGAVLYEMLSGKRAFEGDDVSETLAAVLRQDVDWSALPAATPPALKRLVIRCLERDVRRRLRDIGEARILLEDPASSAANIPIADAGVANPELRRPSWRRALAVAAVVLLAAALGAAAGWYAKPLPAPTVTRFRIALPEGVSFTSPARHFLSISPDGTRIVFVGNGRLYSRLIDEVDSKAIPGTEDTPAATHPTISPDGQSVVFWAADLTIKRVPITGGTALTVCQSENPFGISWTQESIVIGQGTQGVTRVPASGGKPEVIATVKPGEIAYGPQILPGGTHLLFTVTTDTGPNRWDKARIVVQSLASAERQTLIDGGADGRYLPTGHIIYAVGGILFAAPFDASTRRLTGNAVPIVQGIRRSIPAATGAAQFAVADTGTMVYVPGPASMSSATVDLALIDRDGTVQPLKLPRGEYMTPRASPDGTRIAFGVDPGGGAIVAVYDLAGTRAPRPLTLEGNSRFPVWTSDGKRIAYQSDRDGDLGIFWQPADGSGVAERLTSPGAGESHFPEVWSPTSNMLLLSVAQETKNTLWTLSLPDKRLAPFAAIRSGAAINPVFSPDGRWLAYQTDQTGRTMVYVQPVPPTGAVYSIRGQRADQPHEAVWSPDGKELFYNPRAGGFEVVAVTTQPEFAFGNPTPLPRPFQLSPPQSRRAYDVTPAGKFVGLVPPGAGDVSAQLEVVVNWSEELKRLVPVK